MHKTNARAADRRWTDELSGVYLTLLLILLAVILTACNAGSDTVREDNANAVSGSAVTTNEDQRLERENLSHVRGRRQYDIEEVVVTGTFIRGSAAAASSPAIAYSSDQIRQQGVVYGPYTDNENYLSVDQNPVRRVSEEAVSTFSIDVDTAAYSNIRRMLTREGRLPPHDAVRLEEMINYFDFDYPSPEGPDQPLSVHTELMQSPWNAGRQLMMVGIQGYKPAPELRPDANLVFLVDVSGSMQSPDKLGLVKQSLRLLVSRMTDNDRIALVVYAGAAGVVLDSTAGSEKTKIHSAIDSLAAGGSTNGGAGIELAYRIAEENLMAGGINRVILASDGDLNVGVTSIDALKELIARKREKGIALTTLGYGTGNYNYSLMEQLADTGDGNAAYIDSLSEARKVLVEEMQSTLLTIARDVKIQVEFNPATVAEYRLIGYENRLLQQEDFLNDKVDAGEIGAGHTVTALYEITPVGSDAVMIPGGRYAQEAATVVGGNSGELAFVKIRYKLPGEAVSSELDLAVRSNGVEAPGQQPSDNIRFAAAVAGFGELMRGGKYTGDWQYADVLQLARQSRGNDDHGYRSELLTLVQLASTLD